MKYTNLILVGIGIIRNIFLIIIKSIIVFITNSQSMIADADVSLSTFESHKIANDLIITK